MAEQAVDDPVQAAEQALARGEWEQARDLFEAALAQSETAAAWEGLGWAGWWLADEPLTFRARERAYRAYRADDDLAGAGRVAIWIAADYREFRAEAAVARGWLERARRLLDPLPTGPEHGWLKLTEADFALNLERDYGAAAELGRAGAKLGAELGVPDLEAVGRAIEGLGLVGIGRLADGMRRLDEASAIAVGEDLHLPLSQGWAMCCTVSACDSVGDFERAAQWCAAMRALTDRWGGRQLLGVCRSSYGRVLATRGEWDEAERELVAAVGDFEAARPGMAVAGLVRLGELRARQGRTEEARELFERSGPAGLVGLGELALAAGDPTAAAELAERVLRRIPDRSALERLPGLELLARARAGLGEPEAAQLVLGELERAAEPYPTAYVRGRVRHAAADVAAAVGDHETARRGYEDAIDLFDDGAAPYDAALARLGLARELAAAGRAQSALAEASAAREVFERLGARRDVEAAAGVLEAAQETDRAVTAGASNGGGADMGPSTGTGKSTGRSESDSSGADEGELSELTPRELEVLRLVAQGLSDAEIAERLVLSPHTVHRHVANIRVKLALPSRAAAVAYAARQGLL